MATRRDGSPSLRALLLLIVAALAPAGCGERRPATRKIVVIPKGTTHEFWKMIHAGVEKAVAEINASGDLDVPLQAVWKGPLREDETQDQIEIVEIFLNRNVQGMVLAPLDRTALKSAVAQWKKARRPVVIIDSGLDGEPGTDFATYVATDNYRGGVLAAQHLGSALGKKGKAIILKYMVGSESTEQREKGFLATLAKEFPDVELISSDQYAGATEQEAFEKSQNILNRYKDEVEGIFCPNESSVAGMLGALEKADMAGKIKFIGFDASEKLVKGLREGKIHGLVLQNPIGMGYEGVKALMAALDGKELPKYVDTGVVVATPDNMGQPKMMELHSPDLSRWLKE